MNDQLQTLSAIFNRTNSVLRLHHPFVSEKYQDSQDKYVKQLSETILKLQERWEDKSADLEELHREIDDVSTMNEHNLPKPYMSVTAALCLR